MIKMRKFTEGVKFDEKTRNNGMVTKLVALASGTLRKDVSGM